MKIQTHLRAIALYPLLILCISLPQSAWGQNTNEKKRNIYAIELSCTTSDKNATIKLRTNEDQAKGVWVYIDKDKDKDGVCEQVVYSDENTTIGRTNYVTLPLQNLPGGHYKWAVKVQGNASDNFNTSGKYQASTNGNDHSSIRPACANPFDYEDNRYKFQYPKGLAVNTYHDSKYLGCSYVGEAGWLRDLTGTNHRTGSSRGIYVFGPNLGQVWSGQTYKAFTGAGGIDWIDPDDTRNKYFGPNRVSTDKDGYVYVAENRPAEDKNGNIISNERIWRIRHDQMKAGTTPTFTCILTQETLRNANASFSGRVLSMAVGYEDG